MKKSPIYEVHREPTRGRNGNEHWDLERECNGEGNVQSV